VSSPQSGYVYVLDGNRQPVAAARLEAGQVLEAPAKGWIEWGAQPGVERFWLVWSAKEVADPGRAVQERQARADRDEPGQRTVVRGRGVLVKAVELEHH